MLDVHNSCLIYKFKERWMNVTAYIDSFKLSKHGLFQDRSKSSHVNKKRNPHYFSIMKYRCKVLSNTDYLYTRDNFHLWICISCIGTHEKPGHISSAITISSIYCYWMLANTPSTYQLAFIGINGQSQWSMLV